MDDENKRLTHFFNMNNYHHSSEYQAFARTVGLPVPAGQQPSLLGERWEIDEAIYDEFLNMLPPLGWRGDVFYVSEFTFDDITVKFSKEGDQYFAEHARYPARQTAPAPR